jgi:hypothetical protein
MVEAALGKQRRLWLAVENLYQHIRRPRRYRLQLWSLVSRRVCDAAGAVTSISQLGLDVSKGDRSPCVGFGAR